MPEGLLACSKIQDSAERVRCYDAQVAAMKKGSGAAETAAAPGAPASPPAPATLAAPPVRASATPPVQAARSGSAQPTAQPGSAAQFGEEELPQSQRPTPTRKHEMLESSITGVNQLGYDSYLFSLANGQVWRVDGNHLTFFHVGYPVRIERHNLGGYHMSSPTLGAKNWVYVTRVR